MFQVCGAFAEFERSILRVARECGVGSGTVQRVKQEMEGPFDGVAA
jgi:hypothetical protein